MNTPRPFEFVTQWDAAGVNHAGSISRAAASGWRKSSAAGLVRFPLRIIPRINAVSRHRILKSLN
jgi:hypothetical protein